MSYLYDWQNNFSDDPRFWGKAPISCSLEPTVMSVSIDGIRLKDPGAVSLVKSGEKGFVVLFVESKDQIDFEANNGWEPGVTPKTNRSTKPYNLEEKEPVVYSLITGKVVIEFGGQS